MTQTTQPFEELMIPRRDMENIGASLYRVYRDYKNYELVEAGSALEALAVCKTKNPYKVTRHDPFGDNVIQFSYSRNTETAVSDPAVPAAAAAQAAVEAAPATQAVEAAPTEATAPAADAPLSNDDIDKLLNG